MHPPQPISDPDRRVLFALEGDLPRSQRDIARSAGLSLGTTNIVIKRLLTAGHLRISRINLRKNSYILTPRGLAEMRRTTLRAVARTAHDFALIRKTVQNEVLRAHVGGVQVFCIVGDNELAELAESALKDLKIPNLQYARARRVEEAPPSAQALLLTEAGQKAPARGGVVLELANLIQGGALLR